MKFVLLVLLITCMSELLSIAAANCEAGQKETISYNWITWAERLCSDRAEEFTASTDELDTCKDICTQDVTCVAIQYTSGGTCYTCWTTALAAVPGTTNSVYYLESSTRTCEDCAQNFYSTTGTECVACPNNYVTENTRSTSVDDCIPLIPECAKDEYITEENTCVSTEVVQSILRAGIGGELIDISRTQIPGEFFSRVNREEEGDLYIPQSGNQSKCAHFQTHTKCRLGFAITKDLHLGTDIQVQIGIDLQINIYVIRNSIAATKFNIRKEEIRNIGLQGVIQILPIIKIRAL